MRLTNLILVQVPSYKDTNSTKAAVTNLVKNFAFFTRFTCH